MKPAFLILTIFLISCTQVDLLKNMSIPGCDNKLGEHERNVCYNNLAITQKHPGPCLKITDKSYKRWCLGIVNDDPVSETFHFN